MNITHYKRITMPIFLIPNNRIPTLLSNNGSTSLDFTSYQSLSSILYPDELFYYDMINSNTTLISQDNISELFYTIAMFDSNRQYIKSLDNSNDDKLINECKEKAIKLYNTTFGEYASKYSMLELMLILSYDFKCIWHNDVLIITGNFDEISEKNNGQLQPIQYYKSSSKLHYNFKTLWCALRTHISYRKLISSPIMSKFMIELYHNYDI